MFVHFKKLDNLGNFAFNGLSHAEQTDPDTISIPLTLEEYIKWMNNPGLQQFYVIEQVDGVWTLTQVSQRETLPDRLLTPMDEDSDEQMDVLLILQRGTDALVHVFNSKLSQDPKAKHFFFGVEADNAMNAVFEIEATGVDTETVVEYDPDNLEVWIKAPLESVTYGVKILK
jgi:hypothetical protein